MNPDEKIIATARNHPALFVYYSSATEVDATVMDSLMVIRASAIIGIKTDIHRHGPKHAQTLENAARLTDELFCDLARFVRNSATFRALEPSEQKAVYCHALTVTSNEEVMK
ncbi:MAG: hypothetical protein WC661_11920 [Opitutaceae bacterium]|jgi:hypothetical protein